MSTPKSIGNLPRRININRKCVDVAINTDICFSDTKILDNLPDKEKQLKAKERELVNKESALKVKERTLNDTSKKLAAAQSYIYTLEKKIEELEQSLILSERAKSMQNVNSDCNSQSNTNNNSNSELKILEQRFNLLESKVGQFLNSDKSIVINNNNYGSNNRHELSQEGSDTPVYNVQATECISSSQDTVSQNLVNSGVSVDTNLIKTSCNISEQDNTAKSDTSFLEKTVKKKRPPRYRRKTPKQQQHVVNSLQPQWPMQQTLPSQVYARLPVYPHSQNLNISANHYVNQQIPTMVRQPLFHPSMLRTSQQMPYTYQSYSGM